MSKIKIKKVNDNYNFIIDTVYSSLPSNLRLPRKIVALTLKQKLLKEKIKLVNLCQSEVILLAEKLSNVFECASKEKEKMEQEQNFKFSNIASVTNLRKTYKELKKEEQNKESEIK